MRPAGQAEISTVMTLMVRTFPYNFCKDVEKLIDSVRISSLGRTLKENALWRDSANNP